MTTADFAAAFQRHFPELVGRPVLVALSGGSDSVALLCLLRNAFGELGCRVHAAHVHHHLRGCEADADAAHCGELCRMLEVPLDVRHLRPTRPTGSSPEAWWRGERYRALEEARTAAGCAAVATAHTLDDQAETVLLKLLRGAGPRGVAGIRRCRGWVIRPLLDFRRSELRGFLAATGITWREDASNADPAQPRAWVRTRLVPLLAEAFPAGPRHLAAFAASLAEEEEYLGGLLEGNAAWPGVGRPVDLAPIAALPAPLLRRWVLELGRRLPLAEPPSRRQLDATLAMVVHGEPAAVDLGRRWVLRRRGARLALSAPPLSAFAPVPAAVPSRLTLPGGFVAGLGEAARGAPHRDMLHRRLAGLSPAWRSVAPGERFAGRPIARLLVRAGIPAEWRRAWPVLTADGTMVWLPAVGVAEGWRGDDVEGVLAELEEPWERHERSSRRR
jgi:tRNA(Ile)-lysidine synthase